MAITLLTAQAIASNYTTVYTTAKTLFDSLTITNVYEITIKPYGSTKWLIVIVYN